MTAARVGKITRRSDIERIRKAGVTVRGGVLLARIAQGDGNAPQLARVGLVVPRHGNTAVARNRLKRQLRALVAKSEVVFTKQIEIVIWSQAGAYRVSFTALERSLAELARRIAATAGSMT